MIGKMISDENRLRVLNCLVHSDACVCELADALAVPQPTLSNHLARLRASGLVETNREGTWIYYSLAKEYRQPISNLISAFSRDSLSHDIDKLNNRLAQRIEGKCRSGFNIQKEKQNANSVI